MVWLDRSEWEQLECLSIRFHFTTFLKRPLRKIGKNDKIHLTTIIGKSKHLWLYLTEKKSQKLAESGWQIHQNFGGTTQALESWLNVAKRVLKLVSLNDFIYFFDFEIFKFFYFFDSDKKEDEKFYLKSTCDEFYWCLIPLPSH